MIGTVKNLDSSPISSTQNVLDNVSCSLQSFSPREETFNEYLKPDSHPKGPYSLIKIP